MPLIDWNYAMYSVGVEEIDDQHKKLIDLINLLHAHMKEGKGKDIILTVFDELKKYTIYHFSKEQYMMVHHNYTDFDLHKQEHDKFIADINDLLNQYKEGKREVTFNTYDFMKNWLINHIQESDKKLGAFLKANS